MGKRGRKGGGGREGRREEEYTWASADDLSAAGSLAVTKAPC